ncbi:hypothetical protein [Plantibacter sp. T3]|uniref:hypothetical protein n=1 Tax=Plantibacter sp. T3 TaxID=2653161 RepID=UPI0012F45E10|nr:hypothetical protein [Plantibacter sp. T3]VXC12410.1 conserved hypothetical protein [Plantibacter sp. T3]
MGDHRELIVDIDISAARLESASVELDELLEATGWIDRSITVTDWLYPNHVALALGQTVRSPFSRPERDSLVILAARGVYGVGDGTTDPACPSCGSLLSTDIADTILAAWWDGDERVAPCADCGLRAHVGEWNLLDSVAIGELAVAVATDTPEVADALAEHLAATTGRRWVRTHLHL